MYIDRASHVCAEQCAVTCSMHLYLHIYSQALDDLRKRCSTIILTLLFPFNRAHFIRCTGKRRTSIFSETICHNSAFVRHLLKKLNLRDCSAIIPAYVLFNFLPSTAPLSDALSIIYAVHAVYPLAKTITVNNGRALEIIHCSAQ